MSNYFFLNFPFQAYNKSFCLMIFRAEGIYHKDIGKVVETDE